MQLQKKPRILQWLKRPNFVLLMATALGTMAILYGLRKSEVVNFWDICGAAILFVCVWHIQERAPDYDG